MSFDRIRQFLGDVFARYMVFVLTVAVAVGLRVNFFSGDLCDWAGRSLQYWRDRADRVRRARRV